MGEMDNFSKFICCKCNHVFRVDMVEMKQFEGKTYCPSCWNIGNPNYKQQQINLGDSIAKMMKEAYSEIPATYSDFFKGKQWTTGVDVSDDGRHDVSDKMLSNLKEIAYKQDDYGIDKYKRPLDHVYSYDWLAMALEEFADMGKYIQNEIDRKSTITAMLKDAFALRNWSLVESAIYHLTKSGTGK